MTREEAGAEATRLGKEHPDRARFSWLAREGADGAWTVARIGVPSRGPLNARTGREQEPVAPRHDPRPPVSPDIAPG
jgi:hypothetical protein